MCDGYGNFPLPSAIWWRKFTQLWRWIARFQMNQTIPWYVDRMIAKYGDPRLNH